MGDCISALYAEGIHCEQTFEPFFLRETRRKLWAAVYRSDKTLATFFGRPPMMSWRYSERKLPLDLSDETIVTSDPEKLNDALSKLDPEGWNIEGKICPTSWIRIRCQLSVLRERMLEQSLSGEPRPDVAQKLQYVIYP